ncbi:hypothetical protein LYSHEL_10350 [Lysobacter helvus]|uniref:Lipoprotein n=2 Tax=Lysobacteraceae TaxID=32033 RepID=A0ABN6FRE7_9GAMM|nr:MULTISPECIES: hypothetical protein [Lysobacter]BCT92011.1 hypothetical protein LYSCAS_10350 [Lysobacter caseinilyticus]BCT95164.1 hypothetical protein LYSHEL_10350 [Lysobacter helvus]
MTARTLPLFIAIALLAACGPKEDPQAAAQAAAAQQAQAEQAAEAQAKQFDEAFAKEDWKAARGYGDILELDHPQSAAAKRIHDKLLEAKTRIAAQDEQRRMAALWAYQTQPAKGGNQVSAALYSKDEVDTDGKGKHPVRLIFRDHPEWGRSAYLVLEAGDFNCYAGCKVKVRVDDEAPKTFTGDRPKTDEAIAMFIKNEGALWRLAKTAKNLTIEFPVKAGGTRTAVFVTGGVDATKMPKW